MGQLVSIEVDLFHDAREIREYLVDHLCGHNHGEAGAGRHPSGFEDLPRFIGRPSLGNIHRPLSDRQLDDKLRGCAARALPADVIEVAMFGPQRRPA